MTACDIAIVGAGPFGLSLAAYLHGRGADFRIFGDAMQNWRTHMPKGMLLKSEGFASTLYDPRRSFTLEQFCREQGIVYRDLGLPVRLDTFSAYGQAFQQRLVPQLENDRLASLHYCRPGFELHMTDGKLVRARRVVLAVGIDYFRHIPAVLADLPADLVSHCAAHHDLARFRGSEVAVIGSGASAVDTAVLLHEIGARVQLVARRPFLSFGTESGVPQSWWQRLRKPVSGIGPGLKNRFFCDAPGLFRYFPDALRIGTVATFLGPSAGWFMRSRAASVPVLSACQLQHAEVVRDRVQLHLLAGDGQRRQLSAEHVIAATGYQTDLQRLPFFSKDIRNQLDLIGSAPRLSANFESSLQGLYFIGPIAANSFGPVMRFVFGADFSSRRLSQHLAPLSRPVARAAPPAAPARSD